MGATNFVTGVCKGATIDAAYGHECHEARLEHGSMYTGTIAETSGWVLKVRTPMTAAGAMAFAQHDSDNCDKWGPARAIPVAADSEFTTKKVKVSVELPTTVPITDWDGKHSGKTRATSEWDLRDAVDKQVFERYGAAAQATEVKTKFKAKPVVTRPAGRAVVRYQIDAGYGQRRNKVYSALGAAVKAAKDMLGNDTQQSIGIRAVRYYPDNDSTYAATVRNETVLASAEATVTVTTLKRANAPVIGWVFYGIASC